MAGGELGAMGEGAVVAGEGAQVDALQLAAQLVPGLTGAGLGDADQQQGKPAQGDVGADPAQRSDSRRGGRHWDADADGPPGPHVGAVACQVRPHIR